MPRSILDALGGQLQEAGQGLLPFLQGAEQYKQMRSGDEFNRQVMIQDLLNKNRTMGQRDRELDRLDKAFEWQQNQAVQNWFEQRFPPPMPQEPPPPEEWSKDRLAYLLGSGGVDPSNPGISAAMRLHGFKPDVSASEDKKAGNSGMSEAMQRFLTTQGAKYAPGYEDKSKPLSGLETSSGIHKLLTEMDRAGVGPYKFVAGLPPMGNTSQQVEQSQPFDLSKLSDEELRKLAGY